MPETDMRIGIFDSWEIIDERTAVKTCDKSFLDHNGSGVLRGIYWFFGADKINPGESKYITIQYRGSDYTGRISTESIGKHRIRIF